MPPVRFVVYFDYLCPWCYNASKRLHRLRDTFDGRVELEWRCTTRALSLGLRSVVLRSIWSAMQPVM